FPELRLSDRGSATLSSPADNDTHSNSDHGDSSNGSNEIERDASEPGTSDPNERSFQDRDCHTLDGGRTKLVRHGLRTWIAAGGTERVSRPRLRIGEAADGPLVVHRVSIWIDGGIGERHGVAHVNGRG